RRRGGATGAHGQQEIAPGEAPGALGHDCLLDLIVLAAKYAPILEHFKCRKLKLEEAFCEAGDRLVEMGYLRLRYCIAQWPRCRPPAHGSRPPGRSPAGAQRPGAHRTAAPAARRSWPGPPPPGSFLEVENRRFGAIFHHVDDAAIAAHLQATQGPVAGKHRMAAELAEHAVDHLSRAERLATAHAMEWLGLVQRHGLLRPRPEEQPRHQLDRVLRAGLGAQAALHAVALDEAQPRRVGGIEQRRFRAGADASLAQRAGLLVDEQGAERRARRKLDFLDLPGCIRGQMIELEIERGALL